MTTERWEAVLARVVELGRAEVRAGVVGPKAQEIHGDTGLTNAVIGLIHELGLGVPERSFVRKTLRDPAFVAEFSALQARIAKAVLAGKMDRDRALGLLGAFAAGKIQRTIVDDQVEPELQPATVERKGSSKVLVDTGQLVGAIGFEIRK